ncbi:SET domain-containing protein SmydA-8-like [Penaeus japonicus]|uniref:SET domain-containing protein SmydA-8-like n=1 Tax=Penaeus japonicus TaxID=27405 RepID=UPI001C710B8D|nr:SET domain-containing protein SmydA-8-like [Penaeus japonicus]
METEEHQGVAALERYMTSLASINPSWCDQDKHEASDNFSERLQLEYCPTKRPEVLRSSQPGNLFSLAEERDEGRPREVVEIHSSPGFGRYLVASRNITAGEVVFREVPLVVSPKAGSGASCLSCLRPLQDCKWIGCEQCGAPLCKHDCEGGGHTQEECRLVAPLGLKGQPQNTALIKHLNVLLTPIRTILLMKKAPAAKEVIAALQSHAEERRKLPIGRFVDEHVAKVLRTRLGLPVDRDIVQHLCGIFDTNAFEFSDGDTRGRALLPAGALMNHSCTPNTQHWYRNGVMTVRAVVDIPEGAPVTNAYTNTLWGTRARAAHLNTSKLFTCTCERCLDPTELGSHISSVLCRSCNHGRMLPPSDCHADWECQACGTSVSASAIETLLRAGGVALGRLPIGDASAVAAAHSHLSRVLGDTHYIVVELKYALVQALMASRPSDLTEDDLFQVLDLTSGLLRLADLLEPGLSRFRGILLLERCRAGVELLQRRGVANCDTTPSVTAGDTQLNSSQSSRPLQNVEVLSRQLEECHHILHYDARHDDVIKVKHQLRGLL